MIRLIACLGLILAMVVTMDRVLASSLGELLMRSEDRFLSIYKPGPAAEVLVLGNSRADNHLAASTLKTLTCWNTLNLGMGGGPTTISDLLFQDYVERHGAPRLLILEPTSVVDNPFALADLPLLSHYSPRIDRFVRKVDFTMWAGNQAFNLLVFNSNQTIRLAAGLWSPPGDRTLTGSMPAALRQEIERAPEETMQGYQHNWEALDRIIDTAHRHGTKVAVVITPYYPGYIRKLTNFDAFFAELKARLPQGVAVIDARHAVKDDSRFMDALHINADGVRDMFNTIESELRPLGNCPIDAIAQLEKETGIVSDQQPARQ